MGEFKVGLKDLVHSFTGEGGQDLVEWLDKLELVAKSFKLDNLQTVVPLFLAGGAYSVYRGLSEETKGNYASLKQALMTAFVIDSASAFEQFRTRRLQPRESVDVYLADITRLANLVDPAVSDVWIKHAFVAGLPDAAKERLRTADHLSRLKLGEVVERARVFVSESSDVHSRLGCSSSQQTSVVADVHSRLGPSKQDELKGDVLQQMLTSLLASQPSLTSQASNAPPPPNPSFAALSERSAKKRFLSRDVKEAQQKAPNKLVCFRCSGYGHFARHCPTRDQKDAGNE